MSYPHPLEDLCKHGHIWQSCRDCTPPVRAVPPDRPPIHCQREENQ